MLGHEGQAAEVTQLINSVSAANTAAATSGWVDVRKYEGDLVFLINPGAITGSCTPSIEDATDSGGTGAAAVEEPAAAFKVALDEALGAEVSLQPFNRDQNLGMRIL